MNQILSVEMPKNNKSRNRSTSNKANIKTVIIFFCIILILFAIIIGGVGVYSLMNKNKASSEKPNHNGTITGTQAKIDVEVESESKIKIVVTHDKQISKIEYNWNGENTQEISDIGETSYEIPLEVPTGTNTLNVTVTDVNGVKTKNEPKEYTNGNVEDKIKINIIEEKPMKNPIRIKAESNVNISTISYNWDGGEEKQIQINATSTEQSIEVPQTEGKHILNMVAVDVEGKERRETFTIWGDNKPELKLSVESGKLIINASDDQEITKVTVNINGKQREATVNKKEFNGSIPLDDGENKIIVTVSNITGVQNVQRVRVVK